MEGTWFRSLDDSDLKKPCEFLTRKKDTERGEWKERDE